MNWYKNEDILIEMKKTFLNTSHHYLALQSPLFCDEIVTMEMEDTWTYLFTESCDFNLFAKLK